MRMKILGVATLLAGLSHVALGATIYVVGSVNITSGTALDTVTGTSITFSPPCDTTASAASIALLGGCAQGEVAAYSPGTAGTPGGPLESTGPNGSPPVGSGVFIASLSTSTTFPLNPGLEFVNSTTTAIGIVVQYGGPGISNPVGPGTQTDCALVSVPNGGPCSLYVGDPITLAEGGNGVTTATLDITGLAWDPTQPSTVSSFIGGFTTQITSLPGITGPPTPAEIQAFFGCPTTGSATAASSCTNLGASFQTASSGQFTATFTPPPTIPEPGTMSLMMIGTGLISLAALLRRRGAKVK